MNLAKLKELAIEEDKENGSLKPLLDRLVEEVKRKLSSSRIVCLDIKPHLRLAAEDYLMLKAYLVIV